MAELQKREANGFFAFSDEDVPETQCQHFVLSPRTSPSASKLVWADVPFDEPALPIRAQVREASVMCGCVDFPEDVSRIEAVSRIPPALGESFDRKFLGWIQQVFPPRHRQGRGRHPP